MKFHWNFRSGGGMTAPELPGSRAAAMREETMDRTGDLNRSATVHGVLQRFKDGAHRETGVREQLERIADRSGEGSRAFLKVYEGAVADAAACDRAARHGTALPPYAGVTVSIKDLFDVAGEVTTSGSKLLTDAAPAVRDAEAVARLKSAGFIPVGRTNMTEFAFSGLGINPHHGTPLNPYGRTSRRIPGGSSSGAAVSVSDGMATVALGTDTGGSCRIPAALCGLVGFKPTASRVPSDGAMPLSTSLDSIGSVGRSVACCAAVDEVVSGQPFAPPPEDVSSLTFCVPSAYVFDDIDQPTAAAFDRALSRLSAAGVTIVTADMPEFLDIPVINAKGGLAAREAYLYHRRWLQERGDEYDPRVLVRILKGEAQSDADYRAVQRARSELVDKAEVSTRRFDAVVMPTVPKIAPTLDELADDDAYGRINLQMLRNPTIANMLDRCAISLPCHEANELPVGLMLMGRRLDDHRLLNIADRVERLLSASRSL
jgi:aspartyl-tRNA(Asn)/glutamyl-tRNA(Gln) amidotransferase subunit A